jgi:hypothetical protein
MKEEREGGREGGGIYEQVPSRLSLKPLSQALPTVRM